MKYAIENNSGQWWTGECWGVIQARELYNEDGLPGIDGLELWVGHNTEEGLYYEDHCCPYDGPVAGVRLVK